MKRHWRSGSFLALLVVVGVVSYIVTDQLKTPEGSIAANFPTPEEYERFMEELREQQRESDSKPRFTGKLGSFEFGKQNAAGSELVCEDPSKARGIVEDFLNSELNKPSMTNQIACADNTVVAVWSRTGKRSYYRDTVRIEIESNRERIELTQLDGHEALIIRPPTDLGPTFVYVIQREESENKLGIFIEYTDDATGRSLDELAREALEE